MSADRAEQHVRAGRPDLAEAELQRAEDDGTLTAAGAAMLARLLHNRAAALGDEISNLRKEAAAALGEIAHASARPYLERYVDDGDPDVRKNVRWALSRIE